MRISDHAVVCRLCGRDFRAVSNTHLVRVHGFDPEQPIDEYKRRFHLERAECAETRRLQVRALVETWERQGRRWTRERVTREILRRAREHEPLNVMSVRAARPQLVLAARALHGGWDEALASAGLDARCVRRRLAWDRQAILDRIRRRRQNGEPLRRDDRLAQAARREFGSWSRALRAAGVDPDAVRLRRVWTTSRVIAAIRGLGRVPSASEMRRLDARLFDAARRRWRTWETAVAAAGRPRPQNGRRHWSRAAILEEIRRRARMGESLRARDIASTLGGLWRAARREFGRWSDTVRAAGAPERAVATVRDLIWTRYATIIGRSAIETLNRLRDGSLSWTALTREKKEAEAKACAYCGATGAIARTPVVPPCLRVVPACAGCPKLAAARNQVWACAECADRKGALGVYDFCRRRGADVPPVVERKYLATVYDCHACAGTLDADGGGRLSVADVDSVVARHARP